MQCVDHDPVLYAFAQIRVQRHVPVSNVDALLDSVLQEELRSSGSSGYVVVYAHTDKSMCSSRVILDKSTRMKSQKTRVSFTVPHEACTETSSKWWVYGFPLMINDTHVCMFTYEKSNDLLQVCTGKCIKTRLVLRKTKKQGCTEVSDICKAFLFGLSKKQAEPPPLPFAPFDTHNDACEAIPETPSGMDDQFFSFLDPLSTGDIPSGLGDVDMLAPHTTQMNQSPWNDAVYNARVHVNQYGCGVDQVRYIFTILSSVGKPLCPIEPGDLCTTKYLLTVVGDKLRRYMVDDMLDTLPSASNFTLWLQTVKQGLQLQSG